MHYRCEGSLQWLVHYSNYRVCQTIIFVHVLNLLVTSNAVQKTFLTNDQLLCLIIGQIES